MSWRFFFSFPFANWWGLCPTFSIPHSNINCFISKSSHGYKTCFPHHNRRSSRIRDKNMIKLSISIFSNVAENCHWLIDTRVEKCCMMINNVIIMRTKETCCGFQFGSKDQQQQQSPDLTPSCHFFSQDFCIPKTQHSFQMYYLLKLSLA